MVTYLGSLVQLCCGEGGRLQMNITGLCGECISAWATVGLPPLTASVLSRSTLLRLHVDLQVNCLKFALGCVHFPGLSHSGSGSWVLQENTDSVGPIICAFPRSEQLRGPGAWRVHSAQVGGASYHLPSPSPLASWVRCQSLTSGVP